MKPKVSILCITYNQSKYIGQALDSFLSQKTNFPFEVIIHDDKSTDGTAEIIKDYARRSPDIIKPIFEKKNQYSQHNYTFITDLYKQAGGKYIAFCEGDDYWTDSTKLQRQVDFLDAHPDYSVCFHPAEVVFENDKNRKSLFPEETDSRTFTVKRLLEANFIQTSSVMYRTRKSYADMESDPVPGDWYAHLYHAVDGKIGFINRPMSVYRRHDGGVWWNQSQDISRIWRSHGIAHLKLYAAMLRLFGGNPSTTRIITSHINEMFDNIMKLEDAEELKLAALKDFPEMGTDYTLHLHEAYEHKLAEIDVMNAEHQAQVESLQATIDSLSRQLALIKESRIWKMRNRIARAMGKEKV